MTNRNDPTSLDGIGLLRDLPPADRAALAQRCSWRRFSKGSLMIARDDAADDVLFLVEGRARAMDTNADGREITYAMLDVGEVIGVLAAIDGRPRSAHVVALTACVVATLPATAFRTLLEAHPSVALGLLQRLAQQIRLADLQITELATMGAVERVCRFLLRQPRDVEADGLVIDPLPTQEATAAAAGTTRETVGRIMVQLSQAGVVERHGRKLVVSDVQQLHELAGLDVDDIDID
ncbi:MAG: Crp/Fnr family transcriptional regulator [Pseudomonadota bacterium]